MPKFGSEDRAVRTLPKRSLHLQATCRVAQIPSDGKGNWLYSEPIEQALHITNTSYLEQFPYFSFTTAVNTQNAAINSFIIVAG